MASRRSALFRRFGFSVLVLAGSSLSLLLFNFSEGRYWHFPLLFVFRVYIQAASSTQVCLFGCLPNFEFVGVDSPLISCNRPSFFLERSTDNFMVSVFSKERRVLLVSDFDTTPEATFGPGGSSSACTAFGFCKAITSLVRVSWLRLRPSCRFTTRCEKRASNRTGSHTPLWWRRAGRQGMHRGLWP